MGKGNGNTEYDNSVGRGCYGRGRWVGALYVCPSTDFSVRLSICLSVRLPGSLSVHPLLLCPSVWTSSRAHHQYLIATGHPYYPALHFPPLPRLPTNRVKTDHRLAALLLSSKWKLLSRVRALIPLLARCRLWRELFGLAQHCGGRAFRNFMSATASRLNPLRSLFGDEDE